MESRLDKKRPQAPSNIVPLTSKRTLSTSSRHKHHSEEKQLQQQQSHKTREHRRSRSLSSLESPTGEHPSPLPTIEVEGVGAIETDFARFHQKFSPVPPSSYETSQDRFSDASTDDGRVELRMTHSTSDNSISKTTTGSSSNTLSKMEGFFRKTKTALGTVGPKIRDFSFNKDGQQGPNVDGNEAPQQQQQQQHQQQPASEAMKTTLKRFNDKFATRAAEVKSKVLPEFKNRLQNALASSPKAQRRRLLTELEKERRMLCQTKILEL